MICCKRTCRKQVVGGVARSQPGSSAELQGTVHFCIDDLKILFVFTAM